MIRVLHRAIVAPSGPKWGVDQVLLENQGARSTLPQAQRGGAEDKTVNDRGVKVTAFMPNWASCNTLQPQ